MEQSLHASHTEILTPPGSPLSGEDRTVPAVESSSLLTHHSTQLNINANPGNGVLRTPPPVSSGVTVRAR
ncbi:hypothetical protein ebA3452 [Aromatoleum aromaticum EbN1]|uniref:Uncharacterized protein n=1 Tax=Aromatoleum aromaticum (strain DSM 19018 / LMG 30748 / EbN1) TaxID=76114 RepID=Q5P3P0_AROAE|nr:hypothetical protein ebA3452 [Aromatoleum aromaticum EbN1]